MSELIATHYVEQFGTNVSMLLQQKGSKLAGLVTVGTYKGKAASVVDQFGAVNATKRLNRADPVVFSSVPTDRRWVYPEDYDWYDLIDNIDKVRMAIDPQSSYVLAGTWAMGRAKDDAIIAALWADAKTGEQGGTTVTWASMTGQAVSVNEGGTGSGLNVAKLREAKQILMANEVDLEAEELNCIITSKQHDDLLNEVQVVSTDFNNRPVLVDGKVTRFLGINFIHCERLVKNGSNQFRVPVFPKSALHLGVWEDIKGDIAYRNDLRGKPIQIGVMGTFGATRVEEKKLVEIVCA